MDNLHPDVSSKKMPPRVQKADKSLGDAEVETPWQNSHQITKPGGPHWQTHHQNSQGLAGQTTWEHKGAKRGNDAGPEERENPWNGIRTPNVAGGPSHKATE